MRSVRWLILVLSLLPAAAQAQRTQVGARAGWLAYDAGGDGSYPMLQVTVDHYVAAHVTMGVMASWARVGDLRSRPWIRPGSDERVLRAEATAGYDAGRLFAGVPVLEHISPVFTAGVGVVHSAGVETDFSRYANDPYFGITNQRTGLSYGGGVTLEVPMASRVLLTGTFQVWRDWLYGGRLYNFDRVLGLAWRF